MKPFIRKKLPLILIAVQLVLIAGLLLYIVPGRYRLYDIVLYDASENVPANPLTGYAPPAEQEADCEDTQLVFILLPFSEWEPEEGVFDTAGIEKKYHLSAYRESGKHAVLRFVCDIPGDTPHRDIPDWLYQATGDGLPYEDAAGKGYAPDYSNEIFAAAHEEALQALAAWCRRSSFVAYVEMGSVGQNGVWSVTADSAEEIAPAEETLRLYAGQYEEAFPADGEIRLLGSAGADQYIACGSWKDVLGDAEGTAGWILQSLQPVGASGDEDGEKNGRTGMQGAEKASGESGSGAGQEAGQDPASADGAEAGAALWKSEPAGGGLTDTVPMDDLLMEHLSGTLDQVRNSHISFIGPLCPDADRQKTNGSEMILRNVGYCLYLSRLQTTVDFIDDDLLLHFTFSNIGNAPMYWDWPVNMYVYDRSGTCIREQRLDLNLSDLVPDRDLTVVGRVPFSTRLLQGYSVGILITSPDGTEHITLAQKGVIPDGKGTHMVYRYNLTR